MTKPDTTPPDAQAFVEMQASPEFQELRRRLRSFVFPMTAFFLIWYIVYVLLSNYAHDFMSTPVWGNINVGLLLGLGQFVTTFAITGIYVRFANRELDPRAEALRNEMEARS
ncbi:DUF485 domain-containing protein [Rhodococcus sp. BP-252]|nr:DUF485 domain-containing protein [Rhodococcus sp. BP-320]MBY6417728.1 DUF485 domain-containing protein [Rhodococcus sp. BP-321]MBY6423248.1 DUF485 domain-containing protein [Rhodococcus sp. BP-324]MBY6427851.1 DUF485 domain-containing protein [Rhodococcus sp. BP-323]MBY6431850.1 DUF485 domain-containing protein [Rhodococcus sp. BP-322]MBY6441958.1 DUF485 domain-containing protein [Rhodococcus sp. BP-319]MBY6446826.1 DUF485 domain-containing protein [Rhodococcus sp. BP-318]MBY6451624.1 DUF